MKTAAKASRDKLSQTYRDLIEKKAYDLYERRGRQDGCDLDDWLEAERLVKEEIGR